MEVPERQGHQCHCLIIDLATGREVPCKATAGPDQPFCEGCDDRHPEKQVYGYAVTAYIEAREEV